MDYKETLNLPQTDFPMRAKLPQREPELLKWWDEIKIYDRVCRHRAGAPKFILHDGPPYANGYIHVGTALNKVLKDMIIKYKTMRGYDSPYVPGWDTHGLPIEHQIIKQRGSIAKRFRKLNSGACAVNMPCTMLISSGSNLNGSACAVIGKIRTDLGTRSRRSRSKYSARWLPRAIFTRV